MSLDPQQRLEDPTARVPRRPFSMRTPAQLDASPLSNVWDEARKSGQPLWDLTQSNPTRAGLDQPDALVFSSPAFSALASPGVINYQPDPRGLRGAREAVAAYYLSRGNRPVPVEQIFLTASTSEAYGFLLKLLTNPGEEVLVPQPSYPLFEHLLQLEAVRAVPYPVRYDGRWHLDLAALESRITPLTRAIILVNPNNPTGSYLKKAELGQLHHLCRRYGLVLISDEVFADYPACPDPERVDTAVEYPEVLTFSMGGLSKTLGLPHLKLGWILVDGPEEVRAEALERLEFITDTYLSVGTPIQLALPDLLQNYRRFQVPIQNRVSQNRAFLLSQRSRCPAVTPLFTEGGWYQLLQVPRVLTEEAWVVTLLRDVGVWVQPGFFFDFEQEAFLVISLLTHPSQFEPGLIRLLERIQAEVLALTGPDPTPVVETVSSIAVQNK